MKGFGKFIVRFRILIFVLSILLLIPAGYSYLHTRVNYDILYYLPDEIETMQGQDILVDQFGTGAYSMFVCEGMKYKDVAKLKEQIEDVEHVKKVLWYDSFLSLDVPVDMLPDRFKEIFNAEDSTMMFIIFDTTTSADETMTAIKDIRKIAGTQCFVSGMSAVVTDTKDLSASEIPIYVLIAVALSALILALTMESFFVPVVFLASIGMAIVYNFGTNFIQGEISYITKALAAVLQLGVTMDYSIFLWHSYREELEVEEDHKEAMALAIGRTMKSVVGSSTTTVAGFVALCFMSFTLGFDMGVVMAKGVVIGVICCVTILPSLILIFDKPLTKWQHKPLIPDLSKISDFITKHYKLFAVLLVLLIVPAYYCEKHTPVYYKLDTSLPESLECIQANMRLQDDYHMGAVHMLLVDTDTPDKDIRKMMEEIENVDGVRSVLGLQSVLGTTIPADFIPDSVTEALKNENYEILLVTNEYEVASNEVNTQVDEINRILKAYDPTGMLVGEAPCTKDLIEITDKDFATVNVVSILAVFAIIAFVFRSPFLPVLLISVIELAIFINLGIPYLTGTELPFIASIVIGTIQLGSTVDYAILMTGRYETERNAGKSKKEAVKAAHQASMKSIIVSAVSFFAATFGVGLYSNIDMIGSLCNLMSRGALISMVIVLCMLPAMFMVFDKVIIRTSFSFREALKNERKQKD